MTDHLTFVDGAGAQRFTGTEETLCELERRSTELMAGLDLPGEPFLVDRESGTLTVQYLAGYVSLTDSTLEIIPQVLKHDPAWRSSLLMMASGIQHLSWRPTAEYQDATLPTMLGLVLDDGMTRAARAGSLGQTPDGLARWPGRSRQEAVRVWRRLVGQPVPDESALAEKDAPLPGALTWACAELAHVVPEPWLRDRLLAWMQGSPSAQDFPPSSAWAAWQLPPELGYLDDALAVIRFLSSGPASSSAGAGMRLSPGLWNSTTLYQQFAQRLLADAGRQVGVSVEREAEATSALRARRKGSIADAVLRRGNTAVAMSIIDRELDFRDEDGWRLEGVRQVLESGRRLGCRDVGVIVPGFRGPGRWPSPAVSGPGMVHALRVDPSGVSEPQGYERLVQELVVDLGALLAYSGASESAPSRYRSDPAAS